MRQAMTNTMIQWIIENTRFRGEEDEPSRLDLLYTTGINLEIYQS